MAVVCSDSFVSSKPLASLIETSITPQLVCEVAQAHAAGRRLYIGTTNIDTGRLVIWDMGAIAAGGKPGVLELYRKIVLASASVPGFFPPVHIDVTVNGRTYTEMHVDGGSTAQVFFCASMIPQDPALLTAGSKPLVGSRVYVIVAGKSYPDPKCVENRALKIAASSLGALTYAQTRNDLIRIYTLSLMAGMDFRLAAIPQDWPIHEDSMAFEPTAMRSLFDRGFQWARSGHAWADVPPVLDASQQSIPRAGTEFLVPVVGGTSGPGTPPLPAGAGPLGVQAHELPAAAAEVLPPAQNLRPGGLGNAIRRNRTEHESRIVAVRPRTPEESGRKKRKKMSQLRRPEGRGRDTSSWLFMLCVARFFKVCCRHSAERNSGRAARQLPPHFQGSATRRMKAAAL